MKKNLVFIFFVAFATLFYSSIYSQNNNANALSKVQDEQGLKYKDFRFAVGGGYAIRLGAVDRSGDQQFVDISEKLRRGYVIDADAQYFFKRSWGVGLNANTYATSTSGSDFIMPGIQEKIYNYSETQRIIYVGPSFVTRLHSNNFLLLASLGVGPLFFLDEITLNGFNGNGHQATFGANISLSGEFKIKNKMNLGVKLSQTAGSINSITFEGEHTQSDQSMNVSSITISLFLSFRSW